jgi:hypothetical protein
VKRCDRVRTAASSARDLAQYTVLGPGLVQQSKGCTLGSRYRIIAVASCLAAAVGCGGSGHATTPDNPPVAATPTPTPTPQPTPTPSLVPAACQLKAPTVDCGSRSGRPQELAPALQAGVDAAISAGLMYPDQPGRIYDLPRFRAKVVETLAASGVCGAWDYGNVVGDEIYVRSADGCVVEQYDLISGDGSVRPAGKGSNVWSSDFGAPVPGPKPDFPRDGDLSCALPGDRSTFCFSIKNTPGAFGTDVYALMVEVLNENPALFDRKDFVGGQSDFAPDVLRLPAWRITDQPAYIRAVETKLRGRGFCAYVESGDILKIKSLAKGNLFHEEIDIVQNPPEGGSYVLYAIKDRCHDAGF